MNPAFQGTSVSLSADGNTAIVGGSDDNGFAGAAWVWTRSGGVWTQQSTKLVGSGAVNPAFQGSSVFLSADGNTAIVGGFGDKGDAGAAWVWTRSGEVWTQQSAKLVGSGAVTPALQGGSVSLSADGNTAIVGGDGDNGDAGAAWVWTRNGGVWTQQSTKLVGSGAVGNANQGISVALSADGNTAIIGGDNDNGNAGAAWVFAAAADLTITKTHAGNFLQGSSGQYSITVRNVGLVPTSGLVTVTDSLPVGFTPTAMSGTGWICSTVGTPTCTRSDALAASASYPVITLTVTISAEVVGTVTNTATVSGGGDANSANNTASDLTIVSPNPTVPALDEGVLVALGLVLAVIAMMAARRS